MAQFETAINDAIQAQDIPGCVLVSTNRDGSFNYAKSFGSTSMKSENAKPLDLKTVMWVASCTKLMTSICAMQLVERGQLSLDDPIYKHIPELESRTVITSIDAEGKPIEQKHTKVMTLRHLLTHSSGLTYDQIHPINIAWLTYHKHRPSQSSNVLERFGSPLVAEPGESWAYGPSLDYVGLLIERVSGMTLEQFMRENLWESLGIIDMTFNPSGRPDMLFRMADMSLRGDDGKVAFSDARLPYHDENMEYVKECMGGQGSFVSPEEYLKVLKAVLNADVDEKILKKETLEVFFTPQLSEGSKAMLNMVLQDDFVNNAMGGTPKDIQKDWGLGGLLLMGDAKDGKKAGTMIWGGYPNLIWWVDRKSDLCGLYAGQVLPPGDTKCVALKDKFEEGMYTARQKVSGASRL